MKKIAVGILIGFVLSFSVSAYAEEIKSLVGKAVQKEVVVTVDGNKIDSAGIIVNGSTYLPVRKIADSVGYDVNLEKAKGVLLSKKTESSDEKVDVIESDGGKRTISGVQSEIEDCLVIIQGLKISIQQKEKDLTKDADNQGVKDELTEQQGKLKEYQTKLEALQKEKAELESK